MRFNDETMLEICQARERLMAYKLKCQPYPLEEIQQDLPQVQYDLLPEHRLMKKLQEVEGKSNYAVTRLQEHLGKPKRKSSKYD